MNRDVAAEHHDRCGPEQDAQIEPNASLLGVKAVQLDLLGQDRLVVVLERVEIVEYLALTSEGELRKPRHPGPDGQNCLIVRLVAGDEVLVLRTRTDEAHFTPKHLPQLRKLVHLRLRKPGSQPREPQI